MRSNKRSIFSVDDTDGMTSLMLLCRYGNNIQNVKSLINANANVNITDILGCNALMYTCINPNNNINHKIVKLLIKSNININLQDNNGWTALTYAHMLM